MIVQIADLGLACKSDDEEQIIIKCGTPGYVAPELLNKNAATTKIDIFSLGCVFFNLITYSFLFKGNTASDVLKDNQYSDP